MSLTIKTGLCLYHIFFLTTLIPQTYIRRRACAMVQLLTAHGPASAGLTSQLLTLLTDEKRTEKKSLRGVDVSPFREVCLSMFNIVYFNLQKQLLCLKVQTLGLKKNCFR